MTYVIAEPCIDVVDHARLDECPVDSIYEGSRALYIHPDECIDWGACEPVCPVEAISYEDDPPRHWAHFQADNARFFTEVMRTRDTPRGSPGCGENRGSRPRDRSGDRASASRSGSVDPNAVKKEERIAQ